MADALAAYREDRTTQHPIVAGARLHFAILHIHPFKDGNGRAARLVSNLNAVRAGYPPVLIGPDDREAYFAALETSHVAGEPGVGDPFAFTSYMIDMQERSLKRYLNALEILSGD